MGFRLLKGRWEDNYNVVYLPNSIDPVQIRNKLKESEKPETKEFPASIVQRDELSTNKKKKS